MIRSTTILAMALCTLDMGIFQLFGEEAAEAKKASHDGKGK